MSTHRTVVARAAILASLGLAACVGAEPEAPAGSEDVLESAKHLGVSDLLQEIINALVPQGYNIHTNLYDARHQNFEPIMDDASIERGRALFGVAEDMQTQDNSGALFEGFSVVANAEIVSNQRSCFTCHRGQDVNFGLAPPPMSNSIPEDDPFFTGLHADAQQDPDGLFNIENFALMKYRPHRFNQARSQDDPFRQVFFWRKSVALVNTAFQHGFLNDGRMRSIFETDRGAIFSHTQEGDLRFDDIVDPQDIRDLNAFQFSLVSDVRLNALRDPTDPLHDTLVNDPFYTVNIQTGQQERGRQVFVRYCMSCHNAPNVFNNTAGVEPLGTDGLNPEFPVPAPHVGRNFNIGVSERNRHNLRFTLPMPDGSFETIVLPLANEDGSMNMHPVTFDIGLAATTGRSIDIGRFKVPQLRRISQLAPYFHDNSAATLEEVVDYFNGPHYNNSVDGRRRPIHLTPKQRQDLLAFLYIL